ncbi:hypothetical protein Hanom_Chr06g00563841 [Helianthus anomalus]
MVREVKVKMRCGHVHLHHRWSAYSFRICFFSPHQQQMKHLSLMTELASYFQGPT